MNGAGPCPKCACSKLYVVDDVRQPDYRYPGVIQALGVTTFALPVEEVGSGDGNERRTKVGTFEAWICARCGLTEWYALDVNAAFDRILALGRKVHIRVVERPETAPFR